MTVKLSIAPLMALGLNRADIAALQALLVRSGGPADDVVTPMDNQRQFEEYAISPLEAIEAQRGVDELRQVQQQQDPLIHELANAVDELRNELAASRADTQALRGLIEELTAASAAPVQNDQLRNRVQSIEDRLA